MKSLGILIGTLAALTLAGCSGTSSETNTDEASLAPSVAVSTSGDGTAPAECTTGPDTGLAEQMNDPRVTQVEVLGDCTSLEVSTALADDEKNLALLVCDAAAELALSQAALTSVTVLSENGTELATGVPEQACA